MTSGTRGGFLHMAFGLRLRSAIDVPELARADDTGLPPDVIIECGTLPERLQGAIDLAPGMQLADGQFQLEVAAGRFRVTDGRQIVVDVRDSEAELRPYLLGTVMGALCLQRGLLPLHAAGVLIGDKAIAVAGPSGAGKSTLAAQWLNAGRDVLADDILAIETLGAQPPRALPGIARVRIATGASGRNEKLSLPIENLDCARAWPIRRVYVLTPQGEARPRLCRLRGPEAAHAILEQTYRWPLAQAMGRGAACFTQGVEVARRCEVFAVSFTHEASPALLLEALERHQGET